jgi:hypothetical protein
MITPSPQANTCRMCPNPLPIKLPVFGAQFCRLCRSHGLGHVHVLAVGLLAPGVEDFDVGGVGAHAGGASRAITGSSTGPYFSPFSLTAGLAVPSSRIQRLGHSARRQTPRYIRDAT